MYYYRAKGKTLFSRVKYDELDSISEAHAMGNPGDLFYLSQLDQLHSRRSFHASDASLLFKDEENLSLLVAEKDSSDKIPEWIAEKINQKKVCILNTRYPCWKDVLDHSIPKQWKVNISGLGDVGGILLAGLRLLGGGLINEIGIFDLDANKTKRWVFEVNQILHPDRLINMPKVKIIEDSDIFDCDVFVFCVSVGVPPVGGEQSDVRMAQFEGNSKIISSYARMAREAGFKGIFAVVSDPVDLLCKAAFVSSNLNSRNEFDFKGMAPEQIRGYGLGVMNARASFIASQDKKLEHFLEEGRVFGPHGEGLIVADSIGNYNPELSKILTEDTKNANLEIRKTGFKPYIAPALSSGSLSLIATLKGEWHYSATYLGGVFMGSLNRLTPLGTELERLPIPELLFHRISETYEYLKAIV